jgi:hypothetical protein
MRGGVFFLVCDGRRVSSDLFSELKQMYSPSEGTVSLSTSFALSQKYRPSLSELSSPLKAPSVLPSRRAINSSLRNQRRYLERKNEDANQRREAKRWRIDSGEVAHVSRGGRS